jgi:dTDP-4-dehydrorhamnose reductase
MKRLLVTGAMGQLGRAIACSCDRRGIEHVDADLAELDITSLDRVREAMAGARPDAIVNCAAYNQVDLAETEWRDAFAVNGLGPAWLAVAAEERGIPLVHFSTDYVFDGRKGSPYTVADAPGPVSRYGESKLLGEVRVQSLCRRHLVVRLSWLFGAGPDSFPRKVLAWARGRSRIEVVDDQVSSPTYTVDVAPLALDLLRTGAWGLYHLTNAGHCSRFEWARRIVGVAGVDVEVVPVGSDRFPTPARRPAFSAMDPFPLPRVLGSEPPEWEDATDRFLKEQVAR